jgi:hypothetical protein
MTQTADALARAVFIIVAFVLAGSRTRRGLDRGGRGGC